MRASGSGPAKEEKGPIGKRPRLGVDEHAEDARCPGTDNGLYHAFETLILPALAKADCSLRDLARLRCVSRSMKAHVDTELLPALSPGSGQGLLHAFVADASRASQWMERKLGADEWDMTLPTRNFTLSLKRTRVQYELTLRRYVGGDRVGATGPTLSHVLREFEAKLVRQRTPGRPWGVADEYRTVPVLAAMGEWQRDGTATFKLEYSGDWDPHNAAAAITALEREGVGFVVSQPPVKKLRALAKVVFARD